MKSLSANRMYLGLFLLALQAVACCRAQTVNFATYFGGSSNPSVGSAAFDPQGNIILAGLTSSASFPTLNSIQPYSGNGTLGSNIFVTKLDPTGTHVLFSSFFGPGDGDTSVNSVAVDAAGDIYLAGETNSLRLETTPTAFQVRPASYTCVTNLGPCQHGFVAKIDPFACRVLFVTYLSGSGSDTLLSIVLGANGNPYVAGYTASLDFPVTAGAFQKTHGGGGDDGFVSELSTDGTTLLASTFYGGSSGDDLTSVSVGLNGTLNVAGSTGSPGFGGPEFAHGFANVIAASFSSDLSKLTYASRFGGSGTDFAIAGGTDSAGYMTIAGATNSPNFPLTAGAVQTSFAGTGIFNIGNGFVVRLDPITGATLFGTYFGAAGDEIQTISVTPSGGAYFGLTTSSNGLPTASAPFPGAGGGLFLRGYSGSINRTGGLASGYYIGGNGDDVVTSVASDSCGNALTFLATRSSGLLLVNALSSAPSNLYFASIGPGAGFSLVPTPSRLPSPAVGGSVTTPVNVVGCLGFQAPVALSCSSSSAAYSCSLSRQSTQVGTTVNLTITRTHTASSRARSYGEFSLVACAIFPFTLLVRRRKKLALTIGLLCLWIVAGCGSGTTVPATVPTSGGQQTVVVSGVSGGVTASATINFY